MISLPLLLAAALVTTPALAEPTLVSATPAADAQVASIPGRPAEERFGLAGMEERASLVGGSLTTGPAPDGGWNNVLSLPAVDGGRLRDSGGPT